MGRVSRLEWQIYPAGNDECQLIADGCGQLTRGNLMGRGAEKSSHVMLHTRGEENTWVPHNNQSISSFMHIYHTGINSGVLTFANKRLGSRSFLISFRSLTIFLLSVWSSWGNSPHIFIYNKRNFYHSVVLSRTLHHAWFHCGGILVRWSGGRTTHCRDDRLA
jgi:hypothetical protein